MSNALSARGTPVGGVPRNPPGLRIRRRPARRRPIGAVAAMVLLAMGATATAQTVDDVVRRYLEARGGIAKLRSVQSLRLTGTMELPGVTAPFVLELEHPDGAVGYALVRLPF